LLSILAQLETYFISLQKDLCRTRYLVSHLVAKYFIPNPKKCKYVKHLKGNLDDHAKNLEWIEKKEQKKVDRIFNDEKKEIYQEGIKVNNSYWMGSPERSASLKSQGKL